MSARLHLPGRAPNAGALALVQYLLRRADMAAAIVAIEQRAGAGMVQRIVSGEVIPGVELHLAIVGAGVPVASVAWRRETREWWFAAPSAPRMPTPKGVISAMPLSGGLPRCSRFAPRRWRR